MISGFPMISYVSKSLQTFNQGVLGSSPSALTNKIKNLEKISRFPRCWKLAPVSTW